MSTLLIIFVVQVNEPVGSPSQNITSVSEVLLLVNWQNAVITQEGNSPTLQCTNQLSVDLLTVPRIPIKQCCLVLANKDEVG